MVSNKHLINWFECDFMSITKADFITEFEIKISKSDYKRDFKDKFTKHLWLEGKRDKVIFENESYTKSLSPEAIVDVATKKFSGWRHTVDLSSFVGPNYFYYVCPKDLISESELPKYAGLMYVEETNTKVPRLNIIKAAPKLHKNKATDVQKINISTKYMYDYWKRFYE